MINTKWYSDESARRAHEVVNKHLEPLIQNVFPEYELSHMGIKRDDNTEEVVIKLHLNKLGQVRVVEDRKEIERTLGYSRIGRNNV